MCINTIISSIIFKYPTMLGLAFSITPYSCNGIKYHRLISKGLPVLYAYLFWLIYTTLYSRKMIHTS